MIVCIITAFVIVIDEFILSVHLVLHVERTLTGITCVSLSVIIVAIVVVLLLIGLLVILYFENLSVSGDYLVLFLLLLFVVKLVLCRLSYVSSVLFVLISPALVLCFVLAYYLSLLADIFNVHVLVIILRLIVVVLYFILPFLCVVIVLLHYHPFCLLIVVVVIGGVLHVFELSRVFFIWRVVFFVERVS